MGGLSWKTIGKQLLDIMDTVLNTSNWYINWPSKIYETMEIIDHH